MSKSEESVYISFGEQCLQNALSLYNGRHTNQYVIAAHTMEHVIKVSRVVVEVPLHNPPADHMHVMVLCGSVSRQTILPE